MSAQGGWARVWLALVAGSVALLLACSQRSDDASPADASTGSASPQSSADADARSVADAVQKALAPVPIVAARFAPNGDGFARGPDGVTSPGWRSAASERALHVGARLPSTADQPFEAGVGVSELYRLRLAPIGAAASPLLVDEGRVVYRDAFPSTDVTFVAAPERVEWAYTLRDERAPSTFKLRVDLPKHLVSTRLVAPGALELLDEEGNALLRIPQPTAIDASGTERAASLTWNAGELAVSLDTAGLRYPIVLDPAIETVVWQVRVQVPGGRFDHAVTYDSVRKRVIVFGGRSTVDLADTWEWNGVVWELRATSGPSARRQAAMAYDPNRKVAVMYGGQGASISSETWEWDGTAWIQRCTTTKCTSSHPGQRMGAAVAFDAARGVTTLFGGFGSGTTYADTWTWDGDAWKAGPAGPPARRDAGATYDTYAKRILLFGGQSAASDPLGDLWSFDGKWTALSPSGAPPPARYGMTFVFQSTSGKALLFGGANGPVLSDTWEYSSASNSWESVAGVGPTARFGVHGAYDAARDTAVIFGGTWSSPNAETWEFKSGAWSTPATLIGARAGSASAFDTWRNRTIVFSGGFAPPYPNDTWEWNGYDWKRVCTTAPCSTTLPAGRYGAAAAYDSSRRRLVLFGGVDVADRNDTWEFDGDAWSQKCTTSPCTTTQPSARSGAAMAFDSARGRAVLFGGSNGANETWEWNGATWTRVCNVAPCSTGALPPSRAWAAMTFDSDRNRIVMFGGVDPASSTERADTWEFTGTAWIQVATTGPAARKYAKLAYDSVRKKTILFGGRSGATARGDTWEWNGSTWTQTATTGPEARYMHTTDYDATRRRVVMFGGNGTSTLADTWEYYTRGGACSIGTQCATGFCVDGVCCEQVSCGTCQACDTAANPGVCAPVTGADDPDSCPAGTSTCDATGACKKKQAQSCGASTECATGSCADGYCCDKPCAGGCDVCNVTPGTCTLLANGATGVGCGAYFCDGASGSCPTTCSGDDDCASGFFCAAGGVCQARRAVGKPCNTDPGGDCVGSGCRECAGSAVCKDGYCCGSACAGGCQTCAATPGTCTTVAAADDPDTCTGANTCSASGSCLRKNGQTCATSSQCASGFCVDGFCCNGACAGGCEECSSSPGKCTIVAQGSPGASPSCGAYVCNGSLPGCPTSCGNDSDCAAGYYCAANATCQPRKSNGATCNVAAGADCRSGGCRVCASNNCIDGFCCNTACAGSCDACNGAALGWSGATNGTCATAPASYPGAPSCGAYACNGASATCAASCTSDAQCGAGHYCNASGACVPQKAQGQACNLAADCKTSGSCRACETGNCVDGYCCNTACGGQCQACDVAGARGTCITVTGAVHVNPALPARTACPGAGACAATCNGTDPTACKYAGAAVACGATSCAAGITTNVGTCNGAGACNQTTTPCGNYTCGATSCKTSCTSDADCANASFYCTGGACVPKQVVGAACTSASSCLSGNCVDGVCCSTASCGTGLRCNLAGSLGTCAKPNGLACTSSTECGSGFCVDGVCCDTKCGSQCAACDLTGKVGTCSAVSGPPRGARPACAGASSSADCGAVCDGTDVTACHFPGGAKACGANTCTSSGGTWVERHTSVCDGAGSCLDEPKTCGGFICGASSCKTSCGSNADCTTGFYCKAGACVPIEGLGTSCTTASTCTSGFCTDGVCCAVGSCGAGRSCSAGAGALKGVCTSLNGTACAVDAECASGVCADGVCCDGACDGSCEACNRPGSLGKCVPIVGAPEPGHPPCSGSSTDAQCAARCDGTDGKLCKFPDAATSCGTPSCGGGIETQVSTCDGGGTCKPSTKACAPYVCGPTACLSACTTNDDCATGNYCKSGSCVKVEGLGEACASNAECASGSCADGVCCTVTSCGEGSSCAAKDSVTPGVCLKKKGVSCAKADECATGRCVDGFCCDLACDGQCEACDVTGSEGTCTPVTDQPHHGRPACDEKAPNDCAKAKCDGKTRDRCDGFENGGTISCGVASCTSDKRYQKTGACDGAGACAMPEPKPCTPYACDVASPTGCKTTCSTDDDCADDFKCEAAACVQGATCSEDGLSSIDKTGASKGCAPYRCASDGKCATSCATSDDCAPGTVCDTTVKACVVFQADAAAADEGCGCTTPGEGRSSRGYALLALVALAAVRRRRRADARPR